LRLVQQRACRPAEFRQLLAHVVRQLEEMGSAERLRWLELLSYAMAQIYHERSSSEVPLLQETIESSVRTDSLRQEISQMGKTFAEELMEQGKREGKREGAREAEISARQQTLIRQLEKRFGEVSPVISSIVNATIDVQKLDQWLDQIVVAESLNDLDFGAE
jgi:flagellar biosynthesis/type III secretory pathway protein FliH